MSKLSEFHKFIEREVEKKQKHMTMESFYEEELRDKYKVKDLWQNIKVEAVPIHPHYKTEFRARAARKKPAC